MKSGNLNFLEPSGPLQACNGIALPLPMWSTWHAEHTCTCTGKLVITLQQTFICGPNFNGSALLSINLMIFRTELWLNYCTLCAFEHLWLISSHNYRNELQAMETNLVKQFLRRKKRILNGILLLILFSFCVPYMQHNFKKMTIWKMLYFLPSSCAV